MKHFLFLTFLVFLVSVSNANTTAFNTVDCSAEKQSHLSATATQLTEDESAQLITYFFKIIDQYPLSHMIVVKGRVYDEDSNSYFLLYDIQDGNGKVVTSVAEPLQLKEDGTLFLASGE